MVDHGFGHYISGFIDGEGCFYMTPVNRPGGYRPVFSLAVRADDEEIVHRMRDALGLGRIHYYTASSGSRVVRWHVQAQAECQLLVQHLRRYPLRAKKARDFEVWSEAVSTAARLRSGRADNTETYEALRKLRQRLSDTRKEGLGA